MTTKDYLNQVSRFNRMINNKLTEITQLRELSCSISAVRNEEKVKSSSDPDKIGSIYAKIDEMECNLDKMIDEYIEKKNLIIGQIDGIENEDYYNILFSRYIEKKTFEVIATEMNFSYRNITRLHGKALKGFEDKYGKTYLRLS
jgi:DNA-directed RNA polymerase specialized sigma subunit